MIIAIGADHAGFEMKERVKKHLESRGHAIQDMGTHSPESTDYPPYAFRVAEAVRDGKVERGVLLCDSGNGIAIAANKVDGIRATICLNPKMAELARRHNDANVLVLASAFTAAGDLVPILDTWFQSPFDGGRHARRVGQITEYERTHQHQ
ncbi:MAG: ribose 5-phosphate isomerase B [Candidatus Eisenbacteria bacterium]|uniref:Ribose 5-phosphate isomerase B n=1 Tax=Eiseniibacteriota bacterium TaxID=2212470 RepID=A0A538T8Z1_UNCEI|nr:MAG: ribose 5-phosphate isomerase B [Candidatus Eisenbacteria bacterium]